MKGKSTYWTTSRNTTSGGGGGFNTSGCIIEGTEVHISTDSTVPVESLYKGGLLLTKNGPFNIDDETSLRSISTTSISGELSNDDYLSGARRINIIGVIDINNGLLITTDDHMHIIKRDGNWIIQKAEELTVGDIMYHITDGEIPITTLTADNDTAYVVYKLDVEPNDVFFANGILTHNRKDPGMEFN
jgi:hypothetical protein